MKLQFISVTWSWWNIGVVNAQLILEETEVKSFRKGQEEYSIKVRKISRFGPKIMLHAVSLKKCMCLT